MSEHQHYEFCKVNEPLSSEARKELSALSSRARVGTHGAVFIYNYGDFRGNVTQLLLKHCDVFFYIANWGTVELMFKFSPEDIELKEIAKYLTEEAIECKEYDGAVVLTIHINNEDSFGWIDGDGLLAKLLPLYDEIKNKDYSLLRLVVAIDRYFAGESEPLDTLRSEGHLSQAQQAFLGIAEGE